jgi:predicted NAD-dependent protein-ADP-ribosyltransferase YbiA (DUF1768 family)
MENIINWKNLDNAIYFYGLKNDLGEFSNFYESDELIVIDGLEYKTVEHYF